MEKTQYFTKENINSKTADILRHLNQKLSLHSDEFNINRSALLILDMQRFFFDEESHACMPSGKAIIERIVNISNLFQVYDRPIYVTRHINTDKNAKMMGSWWSDILSEKSELSALIDEINNIKSTAIITKSQYDAFYNTNLNQVLQKSNIEQIVITGVITHLCCETTARSSFVHGYNVFFPIDGTATYNEDIHTASLQTLAHGFANITTINNLIEPNIV